MTRLGVGSQARRKMTMRVSVSRGDDTESGGARDEYGTPVYDDTPTVMDAALPCLAWAPTDVREVLDSDKAATFGAVRFAVPAYADVRMGDAFGDVVDRVGRVIFAGPMQVTAVTRRTSHIAVMARTTVEAS